MTHYRDKISFPSTNPREKQGILQLSQWFKFFLISKYHQCTCQGTIKLEPIKCQKFFIDNLEHVFVIIYSIYFILTVIKGCFKYNFNSESDINGSRIKTQEWKLNLRVVFCSDVLTRNCRFWILPRRYGETTAINYYRHDLHRPNTNSGNDVSRVAFCDRLMKSWFHNLELPET